MNHQLRLVESPPKARGSDAARRRTRAARPTKHRARPASRWAGDWHLDADARRIGRVGVATARDALERAAQRQLREAS